jgi:hypothetical protein
MLLFRMETIKTKKHFRVQRSPQLIKIGLERHYCDNCTVCKFSPYLIYRVHLKNVYLKNAKEVMGAGQSTESNIVLILFGCTSTIFLCAIACSCMVHCERRPQNRTILPAIRRQVSSLET